MGGEGRGGEGRGGEAGLAGQTHNVQPCRHHGETTHLLQATTQLVPGDHYDLHTLTYLQPPTHLQLTTHYNNISHLLSGPHSLQTLTGSVRQ